MKIKKGASRIVFLTSRYAFKIPYLLKYTNFLFGLIANMNEVKFSKTKDPRLARVSFYIPLGLLVVMKKARPLSNNQFIKKDIEKFCNEGKMIIPAEIKKDSFGIINGKLVAIDYG